MTLTPDDIQNKTFDVRMRGYDQEQVNNYLKEIVNEFSNSKDLLSDYESKLSETNDKLMEYQEKHDSINNSIIVAQDAADRLKEESDNEAAQTVNEAQSRAKSIIEEAENNANELLKNAVGQARTIESETEELRKQTEVFRNKLRVMLENHLDSVNNKEWDRVLDPEAINQVDLTKTINVEEKLNTEMVDNTDSDDETDEIQDEFGTTPAVDIPEVTDKEN